MIHGRDSLYRDYVDTAHQGLIYKKKYHLPNFQIGILSVQIVYDLEEIHFKCPNSSFTCPKKLCSGLCRAVQVLHDDSHAVNLDDHLWLLHTESQ